MSADQNAPKSNPFTIIIKSNHVDVPPGVISTIRMPRSTQYETHTDPLKSSSEHRENLDILRYQSEDSGAITVSVQANTPPNIVIKNVKTITITTSNKEVTILFTY